MKEDLCFFSVPACPVPLFPELIGISYCDGSYFIHRSRSPVCVAEYIVKGTGTLIVNGKQFTASAGDVYILPPGTNHTYFSDSENPWTKFFLNISGTMTRPLLEAYHLNRQIVYHGCPAEPLFRELINLALSHHPQEAVIRRSILMFHELLLTVADHTNRCEEAPAEARQLKNYLDSHMDRCISTKELAELLFRSEDYVIKLFKRTYQITPHAYAMQSKISAARRLLTETRLPVQEIAASLGYHDPQYFSNLFRRATGQSPSALRKGSSGHPPNF